MNLSPLKKITYLASSVGLDNRLYVTHTGDLTADKSLGSAPALIPLIRQSSSLLETDEEHAIWHRSVQIICSYLHFRARGLESRPAGHWFGHSKKAEELYQTAQQLQSLLADFPFPLLNSELPIPEPLLRLQFFQNFKTRFQARWLSPRRPWYPSSKQLIAEALAIETISTRIYRAAQSNPKLDYDDLMNHFVSGSHLVFIETEGQIPLSEELKDRLSIDPGRFRLRAESSHYSLNRWTWRRDHCRISGLALMGEILVCPEILTRHRETGRLLLGRAHEVEKENWNLDEVTSQAVTAIQAENYSNGPTLLSFLPPLPQEGESYLATTLPHYFQYTLKHRTLDFLIYLLRRLFMCVKPNVAKHGYGMSDAKAIVVSEEA